MKNSLNLCAELQVDVARLKIFTHSFTEPAAIDRSVAEAAAAAYNAIYDRILLIGADGLWVYPELLESLADALVMFPISAVLEKSGFSASDANSLADSYCSQTESLRDLAKQFRNKNATSVLLALARHIRSIEGVGSSPDEPIYKEVAQLIASGSNRVGIQKQLIEWAEASRRQVALPASGLLYELLNHCPDLTPAKEMLADLIERMENLIYVPLVFKNLGVAVPCEIRADFSLEAKEPKFGFLLGGKSPEISPDFSDAVRRGQSLASSWLGNRGLKPDWDKFQVAVKLPDLRIGQNAILYEQGSIELPVAMAVFCQHPGLRLKLNPEVILTGPILSDSLKPKYEALITAGAVDEMIATSKEQLKEAANEILSRSKEQLLNRGNNKNIWTTWPDHVDEILDRYLDSQDLDKLKSRNPRILTFATKQSWNAPLQRGTVNNPPLLPIKRHQRKLSLLLQENDAVQLVGLSGIGKTFLVSQWLKEVQNRYEIILHTSLPDFPEGGTGTVSKWADGALSELAYKLNQKWGYPQLARKLAVRKELLARPEELAAELCESFPRRPVLFVIDNGQVLLNEDGYIEESRFAEIVSLISSGKYENWKLLFVSNRALKQPFDLPAHPFNDGFIPEEASMYLNQAGWQFADLTEHVVHALGAHPRALALLVGHARDYHLDKAEIYQIVEELPMEAGDEHLRQKVCNQLLYRILHSLEERLPSAWWSLMAASTFIESFDLAKFQYVARAIQGSSATNPIRDLQVLEHRCLVNWSERKWTIHSLVRSYAQDIFRDHALKEYQGAHYWAGQSYFPIHQKTGQRYYGPRVLRRSKYTDPKGCAAALYHYETANSDAGVQAILLNSYESTIPRAQWWLEHGARPDYPTYGFFRAERLLRHVLPLWGGVEEVSADINYLMAKALHRQRNAKKYEEAALHYREAIRKGKRELIPQLISVLCDISERQPANDPNWLEAKKLFDQVYDEVEKSPQKCSFYGGLGIAYEKVARRYLFLYPDDYDLPHLIIFDQAVKAEIRWPGIYLLAADLEESSGQSGKVEDWLLKGLKHCRRDAGLWNRYYVLKAKAGQLNSLDPDLRFTPRGIKGVVSLSQSLVDEGLLGAAKMCLEDALKNYERSADLWFQIGTLHEQLADLENAIKSYEKGILVNPKIGSLYTAVGQLYKRQGELNKAEEIYNRGIEAGVKDGQIYIALGQLYEYRENLDRAEEVYGRGIAVNRINGELYAALGQLYELRAKKAESEKIQKELLDKARAIYRQGIEAGVKDGQTFFALGQLYENQGKLEEAENVYKQGIALKIGAGQIYIALGQLYERQAENAEREEIKKELLDKAEAIYKQGVTVAPTVHIYIALGQLYERQAENAKHEEIKKEFLDKAEVAYRQAIAVAGTFGAPYIALGQLQLARGDEEGASVTFELGCRQAPEDLGIHFVLGKVYEDRKQLDKAEEVYRRRIKTGTAEAIIYYRLVHVLLARADLEVARQTADDAMARRPSDPWSFCALAEVHLKDGQPSEALAICARGIQECGPLGRLFELRVEIIEQEGNIKGAIAERHKWRDATPRNGNAHVALASQLLKIGQEDEARKAVQKGLSLVPEWPALLELAKQLKVAV